MTPFGVLPSSTSAAARRMYGLGLAYQAKVARANFVRATEQERRVKSYRAVERQRDPMRTICRKVCEQRKVSVAEIMSDTMRRNVCYARHEIWWRIKQETDASLSAIGRQFGVHHTSVMYGIRKHEQRAGAT